MSIPDELAPCGVFCGACPSFEKTCLGCPSNNREQKRSSKWGCTLRNCCYYTKEKDFCYECNQFPCKEHKRKLLHSHPGDARFAYRHEIRENFKKLAELGIERYLLYQHEKWKCPSCEGRVHMYHYRCSQCGRAFLYKKQ